MEPGEILDLVIDAKKGSVEEVEIPVLINPRALGLRKMKGGVMVAGVKADPKVSPVIEAKCVCGRTFTGFSDRMANRMKEKHLEVSPTCKPEFGPMAVDSSP